MSIDIALLREPSASSYFISPRDENFQIQNKKITSEEQKKIEELKKIDAKVKAHELAHQAAAGELFRGKSFKYVTGPDGKQYAVGGEVSIDITPDPENPQKTIQKMQKARRAALAPADPSSTDLKIASETLKIEAEARRKLNEEKNNELKNFSSSFLTNKALKTYEHFSQTAFDNASNFLDLII